MRFDFSSDGPASGAQLRYIRRLYEQIDRVIDGKYDNMDIPPMTKKEAGAKIDQLKSRLAKRRKQSGR